MNLAEVRRKAFAMPLNDPAYPPGPYKFYNREFVVITYRTDVDCTPRICELVRYYMQDVALKGAWAGPAAVQLFEHGMCDVARLPVREVVSATH